MTASYSPHTTTRSATRRVVLSAARAERKLAGRKDSVTRRFRLRTAVAAVRSMAKSLPAYLAEQRRLRDEPTHKKVLRKLRAPILPAARRQGKAAALVEKLKHFFRRKSA